MRHEFTGAVVLSAAAFHVGAAAQEADRPLSRSLTVEQAAVYDVQPPAHPAAAGGDGLEVLAWADRPDYTYASGENVRLFVETSKDAYVTVLNVDPAGETTVLFPNRWQSDNFVAADRALEVPAGDAGFRIVVSGVVGTELLKVVASTEPVPLFEARQLNDAGPFQMVRAQPAGLARSLQVVMTDQPAGGSAPRPGAPNPRPSSGSAASTEWAMCHQAITTVPTLSAAVQSARSLTVQRTQESGGSVTCEEAAFGQAPHRRRRSIEGPVTREAVTRSLVLVPADADGGDPVQEISLMLGIAFEFDSAELTEQARLDLDNVADALNGPELAGARLRIEGHTDASGSADYNLRLSQQRAEAVVDHLARRGVAAGRLHAVGFGEHRLLPEHGETDHRQRRVEVVRAF